MRTGTTRKNNNLKKLTQLGGTASAQLQGDRFAFDERSRNSNDSTRVVKRALPCSLAAANGNAKVAFLHESEIDHQTAFTVTGARQVERHADQPPSTQHKQRCG